MVVEHLKQNQAVVWSSCKNDYFGLIDYPEIDYDDNAELLHHLATQAYNAVAENIEKRMNSRKLYSSSKQQLPRRSISR